MTLALRIQGRADRVFNAIKNICQRHAHMTLAEAGQRGLLDSRLQHTVEYQIGKFPRVDISSGVENN
jgi:hypothetical protein